MEVYYINYAHSSIRKLLTVTAPIISLETYYMTDVHVTCSCSEMYHGVRWRQHPLYQLAPMTRWGETQLFVGDFVTLSHPCNLSIGPVQAKILQFYTKVGLGIIVCIIILLYM